MTLVMLIMGLILGFIGCIGIVSAIALWAMIDDKEIRHDIVNSWDAMDERNGW